MGRRTLLTVAVVLAALLVGCSDDESDDESTPVATRSATSVATSSPTASLTRAPTVAVTATSAATATTTSTPTAGAALTARTGIATVDAVLQAVQAADVQRLAGLLLHEEIACVTRQEGIGGPPLCDPGVPAGTRVEVFRAAQCEGFFAPSAGAPQLMRGFLAGQLRIHSVLRAPAGPRDPNRIEYDYAVVFVDAATPRRARALALRGAFIDRVFLGCNQTGEEITSVLFGDGTPVPLKP